MNYFLSCDWGTSAFRLRLVETDSLNTVAEEVSDQGIAKTYKEWTTAEADETTRTLFYQRIINEAIKKLSLHTGIYLNDTPVIASGMLSSSIGMIEIPYAVTPIEADGSNLALHRIKPDAGTNELIIISGIRTTDDVIRGEETKAIGCLSIIGDSNAERLIIFAGTHPKHVTISNNQISGIKTFMTGEFFDLLSNHSVLAASVKHEGHLSATANMAAFKKGVAAGLSGNLLHAAFNVRTNQLLTNMTQAANWFYLSGLLVGTELQDVARYHTPICLCSSEALAPYYQAACEELGINITAQIDADEALLLGQRLVLKLRFDT